MKRLHNVSITLMALVFAIATMFTFSTTAFAATNDVHNSEAGVTADSNHNIKEVKLDVYYDGTMVRVDHPYYYSVVNITKIKGSRNVINKWTTLTVEWSIVSNGYQFKKLSRSGAWDIYQYTTSNSGVPEEFFTVIFKSCSYTDTTATLELEYYILDESKLNNGNNNSNNNNGSNCRPTKPNGDNNNDDNEVEEVREGWEKIGKNWYLYVNGKKVVNQWYYDNHEYYAWFKFDAKGRMLYSQWVDGKYYLQSDGRMSLGWTKVDGAWYYFNTNSDRDGYGTKVKGWLYYNNNWYYLDNNGVRVEGWWSMNDNWYYFNDDGTMHVGWLYLKNSNNDVSWYYFTGEGKMVTGWVLIDNQWFFFDEDGVLK